jgi:two-component system, LuxR family, response regulator FixJ
VTQAALGTVYVIDDDDAVRDSLLFLLDVDGLTAQGFPSAETFLAAMPEAVRGCVVTDMKMPGLDGTDLLRLLMEHGVGLPVIVITGHGDVAAAADVMAAGAFDFIEKPFHDFAILGAVRGALGIGEDTAARDARAQLTGERVDQLPERERQVLDRMVRGETNGTIAAAEGISLTDVEMLRARIMVRLGARRPPDLVRLVTESRRYAVRETGSL